MTTAVRLAVTVQPATIATCELCAVGPVPIAEAVVIYRTDGATVTLVACERCARAARRIVALVGPDASTISAGTVTRVSQRGRTRRVRPAPVLILELVQQVQAADGTLYVVRVYGQERTDGTWEGWLEFVAVGAAIVLRTGIETTQPDRAALAYWAQGLGPSYLEGAVARARRRSSAPAESGRQRP